MNPKIYISFILTLLVTLSLYSCSSSDSDSDSNGDSTSGGDQSLTIGLFEDESWFKDAATATQTVLDLINAGGGVLDGVTLKVDSRFQGDEASQVIPIAESMLAETPNLIGFGGDWSDRTIPLVNEIADPQKIPLISEWATSVSLTGISPFFHRIIPADDLQTQIQAKLATAYGIKKVAIAVQDGDDYSEGFATLFTTAFGADNITAQVGFVENEPDYTTKLDTLLEGKPDAIVIAMVGEKFYTGLYTKLNDRTGIDADKKRYILSDSHESLLDLTYVTADKSWLIGTVDGFPRTFGTNPNAGEETKAISEAAAAISLDTHYLDLAFVFALAIERAGQDGAGMDDIAALRIAVNDNIRKVSRPDEGDTKVDVTMGWVAMKAAAQAGDVNYECSIGNCDMDENGDVVGSYDVYFVKEQTDGTFLPEVFGNVENVAAEDFVAPTLPE